MMHTPFALPPCHACGQDRLELVPGLERFRLVTSDCRPWGGGRPLARCRACGLLQKAVDGEFLADCRRIYESYAVYHQSGGVEQQVFSPDGAASARSEHLLRKVLERHPLPERGRLLDAGCGNGALLRAFGVLRPGWRLAGLDLDERSRACVEALPGVEAFYAGDLEQAPGEFDALTLMHCLEHVPQPAAFLAKVRGRLRAGGLLLVQVPDHLDNPFDLVIADHCSHFDPASLARLVRRVGFEPLFLERGLVDKELTLVARRVETPPPPGDEGCRPQAAPAVGWLAEVLDLASGHAAKGLGLFGTSIAAVWLLANLGEEVRFFVDEDPHRVGRDLFGRPVLRPDQVGPDDPVLLCFPRRIAEAIRRRLGTRAGALILPPPLPTPQPRECP